MINPVVMDLLHIRAPHSRFLLNPSIFYHPEQENCMSYDAYCLLSLSDAYFITHMSVAYPQLHGSWQISPLPPELVSYMISMLRRKPCDPELLRMRESRVCIGSGTTYVLPCRSILLSNIHPPLVSNSSKSTAIGSVTPVTPSAWWTDLRDNQFLRHGG